MNALNTATLERLWDDFDTREELLRQVIADRLGENPSPRVPDHVVATYYFAFRSGTLAKAVEEISYHATSGIKNPPKGSLLEQCSPARPASTRSTRRPDRPVARRVPAQDDAAPRRAPDLVRPAAHDRRRGHLRHVREPGCSADLAADPRRRARDIPRPGLWPDRDSQKTGFALDQPAFGTILKPTAGITPDDVERLVEEVAGSPLLMFIKEDEDLYPDLDYSPVAERTERAIAAIERVQDQRGGLGLVYSPHVTAGPARSSSSCTPSSRRVPRA